MDAPVAAGGGATPVGAGGRTRGAVGMDAVGPRYSTRKRCAAHGTPLSGWGDTPRASG